MTSRRLARQQAQAIDAATAQLHRLGPWVADGPCFRATCRHCDAWVTVGTGVTGPAVTTECPGQTTATWVAYLDRLPWASPQTHAAAQMLAVARWLAAELRAEGADLATMTLADLVQYCKAHGMLADTEG